MVREASWSVNAARASSPQGQAKNGTTGQERNHCHWPRTETQAHERELRKWLNFNGSDEFPHCKDAVHCKDVNTPFGCKILFYLFTKFLAFKIRHANITRQVVVHNSKTFSLSLRNFLQVASRYSGQRKASGVEALTCPFCRSICCRLPGGKGS